MEKLPELKEGTLAERFEKLRAKVNEIVDFVNDVDDTADDAEDTNTFYDPTLK